MNRIGIEVEGPEPEEFEPNQDHLYCYSETRQEAWRIIKQKPQSGEEAIAAAILTLAAQIARIADAVEFVVKEGM